MFVGVIVHPIDAERCGGIGACFAIAPGLIMTADHVIEAARERALSPYLLGPAVPAVKLRIVHRDPILDLALLEADVDVAPWQPGISADGPAAVHRLGGRVETEILGTMSMVATSTSATRGTSDKALRLPAPPKTYTYAAVVLADAPGRGFSGGPVTQDGAVVGIYTARRTIDGARRGVALLIDQKAAA